MSAQRFLVPAAVGTTALGGFIYYRSTGSSEPKSREQQRRERADAKRDAGLAGAGVGQNATTGSVEAGGPGSGVPTANMDPDRKVKTDAPKEKLPSGGVGGGVGAGGMSARVVDISAKKSTDGGSSGGSWFGGGGGGSKSSTDDKSSSNSSSSSSGGASSASQGLQGLAGTGGKTAAPREGEGEHVKHHDTKVYSNHANTPTKRFPGETVK